MLMTSAALARHPSAGLWPGRAALAADAATAAQILRRLYPGIPLYLLGESMGGAVAVVALTWGSGTQIPDVNGVILTAPAVWGRPTMDLLPRLALWAGVRLMPGADAHGPRAQAKTIGQHRDGASRRETGKTHSNPDPFTGIDQADNLTRDRAVYRNYALGCVAFERCEYRFGRF
jgi:alpha-beta hydrolase superfamily lysophospholipase